MMNERKNSVWTDVTNLMCVDFLTGIQRVTREIISRMLHEKDIEMNLFAYDEEKNAFIVLDNKKFYRYFAEHVGERKEVYTEKVVNFTDIPSGAIFFDIDSVWNSRLKRSWLFPILKQKGVKIVTQVYDIIPITHPQFAHENTCMNFMIYLGANITYADLLIVSAQATVDALDKLCDSLGKPRKKCVVVPLGSDINCGEMKNLADINGTEDDNDGKPLVSEEVRKITSGKYILMVGTIEPRKNHSLVIDALENGLADMGVKVIFAGRFGWNVAELEKRIKEHPLYGKSLFFIEKPDDNTVDYLYRNAALVAFPTFNEGFGLPLVEAICRGTPVVASDIGVLREVGGDYADYFDPTSYESFIEIIKRLLCDENYYVQKKAQLTEYVPFTWDQSAELFAKAVTSVNKNAYPFHAVTGGLKQAVVLTARNEDMLATLPYLEKYMPFITEMVICCPDDNVEELKQKYKGRFALKFLTDSEILMGEKLPEDHCMRNFFLRCLMMKKSVIDDVFIMTDDDYRPLREITVSDFVEEGRYKAYYCYDLNEWGGTYANPTSFDKSMKASRKFLSENGYPTMMYASHQPQIIDKRIFNEMVQKFPIDKGLCEWSSYFNYGVGTYPDLFDVVPYISMCWPGTSSDWKLYTIPEEFAFENHYSALYGENLTFHDLPSDFENDSPESNREKINRYRKDLDEQMSARKVYDDYCRGYCAQYREMPSFTVIPAAGNTGIMMYGPEFIKLKAGTWTRIEMMIDERVTNSINGAITISHWFVDEKNITLLTGQKHVIDKNNLRFLFPVKTPSYNGACEFRVTVDASDPDTQSVITIKAELV